MICPHCGAENPRSLLVTLCQECQADLSDAGAARPADVAAPETTPPPTAPTPPAEPHISDRPAPPDVVQDAPQPAVLPEFDLEAREKALLQEVERAVRRAPPGVSSAWIRRLALERAREVLRAKAGAAGQPLPPDAEVLGERQQRTNDRAGTDVPSIPPAAAAGRARRGPRTGGPDAHGMLVGLGMIAVAVLVAGIGAFSATHDHSSAAGYGSDYRHQEGYTGPFLRYIFVLAGMVFASLGAAVATASSPWPVERRRTIALVVALVWHGVAVMVWRHYSPSVSSPETIAIAFTAVYEWIGLIPLALAIPDKGVAGKVRSAVWGLMGGTALGAVLGGVVGGVAEGLACLGAHSPSGAGWWAYGMVGGAVVGAAVMPVLVLSGAVKSGSES